MQRVIVDYAMNRIRRQQEKRWKSNMVGDKRNPPWYLGDGGHTVHKPLDNAVREEALNPEANFLRKEGNLVSK